MERQGFEIPLIIGGATTSRAHTAVKVDKKYHGPVIWVKDASRSVPVVAALLSDEQRPALLADVQADYDSLRERHAARSDAKVILPIAGRAREPHADRLDRLPPAAAAAASPSRPATCTPTTTTQPSAPVQFVKTFHDYPLGELRELHRLAAVLQRVGDEGEVPRHPQQPGLRRGRAQAVGRRPADARLDHRREVARAQTGCSACSRPTRSTTTTSRSTPTSRAPEVLTTLRELRQQTEHRPGVPHRSLADFVAPKATGLRDYVGAFAVTAGLGIDKQDRRVQGRARRLQRDPAGVARRSAGRGVRRAAARAGAHRVLGLPARTRRSTTRR